MPAAAAPAGTGVGIHQGWLPGRVPIQAALGPNGEDGTVPRVEPGPVESGSFTSSARRGATVRWHLLRPPGATSYDLPLVVALHGLSWEIDAFLPGDLGLPEFLADAVADGTPPYAVVAPEGGDTYWHQRPSGEDAGAGAASTTPRRTRSSPCSATRTTWPASGCASTAARATRSTARSTTTSTASSRRRRPGAHDRGFWRRVLPRADEVLGAALSSEV